MAGIFDTVGGVQSHIEYEHMTIHQGIHYRLSDYDADVDNATPKQWLFVAPNTARRVHFRLRASLSASGLLQMYYDPTITANGTAITIRNCDRNSANTATFAAYYDCTTTADGTLLWSEYIGTAGRFGVGGEGGDEIEWILKQGVNYHLKFTPDADDTKISISANFYEI